MSFFKGCCSSQVSQDLPFLHPSETCVLNRLCKMGTDYVRFTEFIEQHTGHVHQQVSTWFCVQTAFSFLHIANYKTPNCDFLNMFLWCHCVHTGAVFHPTDSVWALWHLPAGILHWTELYAAALSTSFTGSWERGFAFGKSLWWL